MKFLDTFVVLATFLTAIFAMPGTDSQEAGADTIEADNDENICRPRLSKTSFHYNYHQRRLVESF